MATNKNLDFSGEIKLEATEGAEPNAPKKIDLLAYTGKPMTVDGWEYPVVIDLEGTEFDKPTTPIIVDHDTTKRIGHTTTQSIDAPTKLVLAKGIISSSSVDAQQFIADSKAGFPFQVSVGSRVQRTKFIRAGESAVVNGETFEGPIMIAAKTKIRELSVTVLGADNDTTARIAATSQSKRKDQVMADVKDLVTSLGLDAADLNEDQLSKLKELQQQLNAKEETKPAAATKEAPLNALESTRKQLAEEELRLDKIRTLAAKYSTTLKDESFKLEGKEHTLQSLKAQAIEEGWSANDFELQCMRAERPQFNKAPAIHIAQTQKDLSNDVLSCAVVRQTMNVPMNAKFSNGANWGVEHWYSEPVLQASEHKSLRNISLHQICDIMIQAAEGVPFSGNRKSQEFLNASRQACRKLNAAGGSGMTTLSVTNIFDDVANKLLLAAYNSIQTTWEQFCGVVNVSDFKTHNMYRLTSQGAYEPIGINGELKHGGFTDEKQTIAAETYGKIVGLTRTHIINDDLGALRNIMAMLGIEAAKTIEELVYVYLLANKGTIFTSGNANTNTGADSDFNIDGLTEAANLFVNQVDADNAPIGIVPDRVLVGVQDAVKAQQIYVQSEVREGLGSTSTAQFLTSNVHVGKFRPIVSPYLNNTAILKRVNSRGSAITGQDAHQWYMFADPNSPQGAVINVALLNGNRTPTLEQSDAAFDMLGMQWRAYHDCGVGTGSVKLGVHSAGQ